jgi:hypothetical protein
MNQDRIDLSRKKEHVYEQTKKSIQMFKRRLLSEKEKNIIVLNAYKESPTTMSEENANFLAEANARIDNLIKKSVDLDLEVLLLDSWFPKSDVGKCLSALEKMTIEFRKQVPLNLKFEINNLTCKLRKDRIGLEQLLNGLNENKRLQSLIKEKKGKFFFSEMSFRFSHLISMFLHVIKNLIKIP